MSTLFGVSVLSLSVFANVLTWVLLKYFARKGTASTYVMLQFGAGWSVVVLVAACVFFAGKQGASRRAAFVDDVRTLTAWEGVLMVVASAAAFTSFYFVTRWFQDPDSGVAKFVPLRTAAAVILLAILGVYMFNESLNTWTIVGLCVLLVGFVLLFIGRFYPAIGRRPQTSSPKSVLMAKKDDP